MGQTFNDPIARAGLQSIYDAVHGTIDVRDDSRCGTTGVISRLLTSPSLDRLRRVEQLGFASHKFIAADHSRYAHSIGTMHMMRLILQRIIDRNGPPLDQLALLDECFPQAFGGGGAGASPQTLLLGRFVQHMLVAALVQDVGELPYNMASQYVCEPHDQLIAEIRDWVPIRSTGAWTGKEIFAVGCLRQLWLDGEPEGIDKQLLVYLITGAGPEGVQVDRLRAFRHMLDGVVDADRLDYVFRDGYHTVGTLGGPTAVIDSLIGYDENGPLFVEPGPVSQFLAARAHLYATVYLSPPNRFRLVVLVHLLKEIASNPRCAKSVFERDDDGHKLLIQEFMRLDDVSLSERIRKLSRCEDIIGGFGGRAQTAIKVFVRGEPKFKPYWLPAPLKRATLAQADLLPDDMFWDTFTDVGGPLYASGSVRVIDEQYKYANLRRGVDEMSPIPLEDCGGPFNLVAKQKSFMLPADESAAVRRGGEETALEAGLRPMPGCVLLFEPEKKASGRWGAFEQAALNGSAYGPLMESDPLTPHAVEPITFGKTDWDGPNIFISFASSDRFVVRKIMASLHKKRRRYCALDGWAPGYGLDKVENSIRYLDKAQAAILVVSDEYRRAFRDAGRPVRHEIDHLRANPTQWVIVPVAADPFPMLTDALPWKDLGFAANAPWMGEKDLRELPTPDVDRVMQLVLEHIDSKRTGDVRAH